MEINRNARGFSYTEFTDLYGKKCSIQNSSLSTQDAIWFGIDDASPQIMSRDAIKLGLRQETFDERDNGWVNFEVPKEVLMHTRMHLSREQVVELLPVLQQFVETGYINKD